MRQTLFTENYGVSTMSYAKCQKPKGRQDYNVTGYNSSLEERVRKLESYHVGKDHYPCKYRAHTINDHGQKSK